jgi:hypothetical protein
MLTGADWEWCLVGDGRCLRIRVQAKKILGHGDLYPHLAYANRRGLQIEMLLGSALENNMLPFYALYHVMPSTPPVRCRTSPHDAANGIFLADAVELYEKRIKVGRQRIDSGQLLADSNPLSCMFCCASRISAADGPFFDKIYNYILESYPVGSRPTPQNPYPGIHETVPAYVEALLQSGEREPPGWIESEFKESLQDVSALLVFDLRAEPKG